MKNLGLLTICLFVLFNLAFESKAQKIQYSPDGNTIAITRKVKFANEKALYQFILFNEKAGTLISDFNFESSVSDFFFSPNGKDVIYSDRLTLEKLQIDEKNKIEIAENLNAFNNSSLEMSLQGKVNDEYLDTALCRDNKKLVKIYSHHFLTYSYPDFENIPTETRSYLPNKGNTISKQFVALSPDCSIVAESVTANGKSTLIIKKQGEKEIRTVLPEMDDEGFIIGKISQNNQTLILERLFGAGFERHISFYDLTTGKLLFVFNYDSIESQRENVYQINLADISPDGKKAAIRFEGLEKEEQVQILFLVDIVGRKVTALNKEMRVTKQFGEAAVFSPDSTKLATLSTVVEKANVAQKIEIWNVADGKKIKEF